MIDRKKKDIRSTCGKTGRFILIFVSIFFLLLPFIYIICEKDHQCAEENCLICENIEHCCDMIDGMGKTIVFLTAVVLIFRVFDHVFQNQMIRPAVLHISRPRIRMNN